MNKIEYTVLSTYLIFGPNRSKIFEKRVVSAAISDWAIASGGFVHSNFHTIEGNELKYRTGCYWTSTVDSDNNVRVVLLNGCGDCGNIGYRMVGVRPALRYSSIKDIITNKVVLPDGIIEAEYGEYVQNAVNKPLQDELETRKYYNMGVFTETGKTYTTDSRRHDEYSKLFQQQEHIEIEYNGKKYVRKQANLYYSPTTLSNGIEYKNGDYIWFEVLPAKLLIDEEKDIALFKDIIIAGIPFADKKVYTGKFNETFIYYFLNTYFANDIIPSKITYKNEFDRKFEILNQLSKLEDNITILLQEMQKLNQELCSIEHNLQNKDTKNNEQPKPKTRVKTNH